MLRLAVFIRAVVDVDVAAVTLRYPGRVAGVTLEALGVFLDACHRHHCLRVAPGIIFGQLFQQRHLEIVAGSRVHDDRIAVLDHVAVGIAARAQQVTVLLVVSGRKCRGLLQHVVGEAARCVTNRLGEFFAMTEWQFPWVLFRRSMAVLALDLDLRQRGARDIAVTVHVDRGVAILAQQAAFRVFRTALDLVMQVVGNKQVILGMQLGLLAAGLAVG